MRRQQAIERYIKEGPSRIALGDCKFRALQPGDEFDFVLLREDGWSLAATTESASEAFELWHWIGFFRRGSTPLFPISEFFGDC